jgi:DHA2 family methylenomycin A resistance protein-like MFS transporter
MVSLPAPVQRAVSPAIGPGSNRVSRWLVPAIALGGTLAPLNSTMIAVALPGIREGFGASLAATSLLVSTYLLVMAAGQPIGGRLGDLMGRRTVFLAGLAVFAIATLGCALAPTLPLLVASRLAQAAGGAVAFPNGTAMIREAIPAASRGRAFGVIGMTLSVAAATGPPLGGLIVGAYGWRGMFWASLPVALIALALGALVLPRPEGSRPRRQPLDVPGGLLFTGALGAIVLIPTVFRLQGGPAAFLLIPCAMLIGWRFVRRELVQPAPMIDVRLFRTPVFTYAAISVALANLVMYTTFLALPLYLEGVLDRGVRDAGILLAILSGLAAIFGPAGGHWTDRSGRRGPAVAGGLAMAAGAACLVPGVWSGSIPVLAGAMAAMGIGLGLSGAPVQAAAIEAAPRAQAGMASGLFSTSRYLGSVGGATVLALVFSGDASIDAAGRSIALFAGLALVAAAAVVVNGRLGSQHGRDRT